MSDLTQAQWRRTENGGWQCLVDGYTHARLRPYGSGYEAMVFVQCPRTKQICHWERHELMSEAAAKEAAERALRGLVALRDAEGTL